ncbi:unnamed protein product [Rhizopus microsporus]|uniref:Uncharacterized protein n=1 Tax=Rhizopus microsporus TaxID=58291 RepID=A0A1X0RRP4_RHIZD|nr:hypothetical protein BCV71DRAFT_267242 [Rhizopus microsporus]
MNFSTIFNYNNNKQSSLPVLFASQTFCASCGVDVSQFSHEFWCRYANGSSSSD